MQITRRGFIVGASGALAGTFVGMLGSPDKSYGKEWSMESWRLEDIIETTTICPYCGVGCGQICHYQEQDGVKTVINIEGDPEHPINEGALCSKGSALYQISNNPAYTDAQGETHENGYRLTKVQYRAPGSTEFVDMEWEEAIPMIAQRLKESRDRTFETVNADGMVVNRTMGVACLGGAALDNEECYLLSKLMRTLGLVYIEHQARI